MPPASPRPPFHPPTTTTTSTTPFTETQRSLQARAQDYSPASATSPTTTAYETRQAQSAALEILSSEELLMWYSFVRNESLAATRRYFERVSAGFDVSERVVWREEWEVPEGERVKVKEKRREKGRNSLGGPGSPKGSPRSGAGASGSGSGTRKAAEKERERDRTRRSVSLGGG